VLADYLHSPVRRRGDAGRGIAESGILALARAMELHPSLARAASYRNLLLRRACHGARLPRPRPRGFPCRPLRARRGPSCEQLTSLDSHRGRRFHADGGLSFRAATRSLSRPAAEQRIDVRSLLSMLFFILSHVAAQRQTAGPRLRRVAVAWGRWARTSCRWRAPDLVRGARRCDGPATDHRDLLQVGRAAASSSPAARRRERKSTPRPPGPAAEAPRDVQPLVQPLDPENNRRPEAGETPRAGGGKPNGVGRRGEERI